MNRENIAKKVKALLAKTLDNGCTEHEAVAALAKAKGLMDAYEISEAELELTKREKALLGSVKGTGNHEIARMLAVGISYFTRTSVWHNRETGINYCGLKADVDLAVWLSGSLTRFVQAELCRYLAEGGFGLANKRQIVNGFVIGAAGRISGRLKLLAAELRPKAVAATGQTSAAGAIAVIQQSSIAEFMAANGIMLKGGRKRKRNCSPAALDAGQQSGDRANFGRPVGSGGSLRLGNMG